MATWIEAWIEDAIALCIFLGSDGPEPARALMHGPHKYGIAESDGTGAVVTRRERDLLLFVRFLRNDGQLMCGEVAISHYQWHDHPDQTALVRMLCTKISRAHE